MRVSALILVAVLSAVVYGSLSVWSGQENNWDFRNYHFYNPYAFLNDRMGHDIAPAFRQTYYNPLPDVPYYLVIRHMPPRVGGFLLGAAQGMNLLLVVLIGLHLFRRAKPWVAWLISLSAGIVGMTGAAMSYELGTTYNDNLMSLFVLGGLYLFLKGASEAPAARRSVSFFLWAGLVLGLGAGLKLTAVIWLGAVVIACLFLEMDWLRRIRAAVLVGLAGTAGLLATGGFWMWKLWRLFGNPLFPYMNHLFKSPYTHLESFTDDRFFPHGWVQHWFYPFVFGADLRAVSDGRVGSWWIAVLYVLFVLVVLKWIGSRWLRRRAAGGRDDAGLADPALIAPLLGFVVAGYVAWQVLYSNYRYLVPLEVLCPLLAVAFLGALLKNRIQVAVLAAILFGLMAHETRREQVRRVDWTDTWFNEHIPALKDPDHSLVLLVDHRKPLACVIPLFPPGVRFIRVAGEALWRPGGDTLMEQKMQELIRSHEGPIYTLGPAYLSARNCRLLNKGLRHYDLETVPGAVQEVCTKLTYDELRECRRQEEK